MLDNEQVEASPTVKRRSRKRSSLFTRMKVGNTIGNFPKETPININSPAKGVRRHAINPIQLQQITTFMNLNQTNDNLLQVQMQMRDTNQSGLEVLPKRNNLFREESTIVTTKTAKKRKKKIQNLLKFTGNSIYLIVLLMSTVYTLINSEIISLTHNTALDICPNILFLICSLLFILDCVFNCITGKNYLLSIHFYSDLIAIFSLVQEIIWNFHVRRYINIDYRLDEIEEIDKFLDKTEYSIYYTPLLYFRLIRITKFFRIYSVFRKKKDVRRFILQEKEKKMKEVKAERKSKKIEEKIIQRLNAKFVGSGENSNTSRVDNFQKRKDLILNNNNKEADVQAEVRRMTDFTDKLLIFQNNSPENMSKDYLPERKINIVMFEKIIGKLLMIVFILVLGHHYTEVTNYKADLTSTNYKMIFQLVTNYYGSEAHFREEESEENRINEAEIMGKIANINDESFPLIKVAHNNHTLYMDSHLSERVFRSEELGVIYTALNNSQTCVLIYSKINYIKLASYLNILRTVYYVGVIFFIALGQERTVKRIVLDPLEVLIEVVEGVAKDPVNQTRINEMKKKINDYLRSDTKMRRSDKLQLLPAKYEIITIQQSIIKITQLLAIGFGEAGGEILRENLSSQQLLNPMLEGRKVEAIFGFCDIRNFKEINIALQEKTMIYVNKIAEIVHSSVQKYNGAVNKNIGEAFLSTWKFTKKSDAKAKQFLCDSALLSFIEIVKKVAKSEELRKLNGIISDSTLLNTSNGLDYSASKDSLFSTSMGFGLHLGWAIEGAIGSFYKVDCSYLSPNVNISARLESASRQYGVNILISEQFYNILSDGLKKICRLIDCVALKGCKDPIKIYTVDLKTENSNDNNSKLYSSPFFSKNIQIKRKFGKVKPELSPKEKMKKINLKRSTLFNTYSKLGTLKDLLKKRGYSEILKRQGKLFHKKFEEGFDNYIEGDWREAYKALEDALYLNPDDGPA